MVKIEPFDPEMLVFIDETGCDKRNLVCQYGYGIRGLTPVTHKFVVYGKCISAIAVMTTEGIEDAYLVEGNVGGTAVVQRWRRGCVEISGNFLFYDVIVMGLLLLFDNVSTAVVSFSS